jgi:hypothetical protein
MQTPLGSGNPNTVSLKTCLMTGSDPGNVAYADPPGNPVAHLHT